MNKKTPVTMDEDYLPQLQAERDSMDPSYQHATKLLDAGRFREQRESGIG